MKPYNPVLKFAGAAAILAYIGFTFVSHLFSPAMNPLGNWLSDYGNPVLNPSGALLYNLGCILTTVLLALFYIGLGQWYRGGHAPKKYSVCYIFAQITGLAACVFLVLASLVPLGTNESLHGTFSMLNMIGMDSFLSFTAVAVFMNPEVNSLIGVLGFFTSFFNIVTTNAFTDLYIAEWIYFLLFMAFVALITANYGKFARTGTLPKETCGEKTFKSVP
jgi:hypothetical protein